jgi:hypothetical protein
MEYAVEIGSGAMTNAPGIMKVGETMEIWLLISKSKACQLTTSWIGKCSDLDELISSWVAAELAAS